ncbi:hypothetical protein [Segetibacter sp.]|jgi:hypothetical protein|uniref:hypothetical protein n=1 Tax=Segetibacter sp. TaxID=2231182 RepID=UPI0026192DCE|nr:hypothetical protein [Segetibacter sp.]MCW3080162.1 hypothetical protein [Segetibacter sp.]
MTNYFKLFLTFLVASVVLLACTKGDLPVDEDGLLITQRAECAVTNFELLGSDLQTVRSKAPTIDTTAQTVNVEVFFGTDLKNVYPQFSLSSDCKLEPKVPGKMDLSDLANPKVFTVVSGNRAVRKPYTLIIKYQP